MKKLGIIGMGISGKAVAEYASKLGYEIYTYDSKSNINTLSPSVDIDLICLSPGINPDNNSDPNLMSIIEKARSRNIDIINDIELFFRHFKRRTIAITGSYGKSTVSSMVHFMLNHLNIENELKGNIGLAIFAKETEDTWFKEDSVLVLELSSAQLETLKSMKAEVGALLNIYPHHLERHGTVPAYIAAKRRILDMSDKHVIGMESLSAQVADYYPFAHKVDFDTLAQKHAAAKKIRQLNKMQTVQLVTDLPVEETTEEVSNTEPHIYSIFEKNFIFAATIVCEFLGSFDKYDELIEACIRNFEPLPHRMQLLAEINGMTVINDSKSTDVHATKAAIESIPSESRIILLCGGQYVDANKDNWKLLLDKKLLKKIRQMIVFGESSNFLYAFFKDSVRVAQAPTLKAACILAVEHAEEYIYSRSRDYQDANITILLSPGLPSFDEFKNFSHRGEEFTNYIKKMLT